MESHANKQIEQMRNFILNEANSKATDIKKKGEEEFSIEVHRLITEQKDKIRQTYEKKAKQIETQYAIGKSLAINKQRLEKIKERQAKMDMISESCKVQLAEELKSANKSKEYVTKLIVQGLLMLLESEVSVRCKEADKTMVETCLADAAAQYAKVIKDETGATKSVKLSIDASPLPAACLGGVVLACQDGKITIDNTVDLRLKLVMEQDKPAIRQKLFPA